MSKTGRASERPLHVQHLKAEEAAVSSLPNEGTPQLGVFTPSLPAAMLPTSRGDVKRRAMYKTLSSCHVAGWSLPGRLSPTRGGALVVIDSRFLSA